MTFLLRKSHLLRLPSAHNALLLPRAALSPSQKMTTNGLESLDDTQVKLLAEQCIVVDRDDNVTGAASKKDCHLYANIKEGFWANTCCSHPLHFAEEMELKDALGVKRAARRKLKHELGIEPEQVPIEAFTYLTRIHYEAPSEEGIWGEHEIDHVLLIQQEVDLNPEPNEVQRVSYVNPAQLEELLAKGDRGEAKVSPWFAKIARHLLIPKWWTDLSNLSKFTDRETIHRL